MNQLHEFLNIKDRLREIFIASQIVLFLVLIGNYYTDQEPIIVWLLLLTFFLNLGPIIALTRGRIELANGLFLTIMSVLVTAVLWSNAGLKDTGLLVYPGLIIYASVLGTDKQFLFVTVFIAFSTMALGLAHLLNLWAFAEPEVLMIDMIDIPLILLIIALASRALFLDIQVKFEQLSNPVTKAANGLTERRYDQLTGLSGRVIAEDYFNRCVMHLKSPDDSLSILSIDLDKFALINDNYGLDVGDSLIIEVAGRLKKILKKHDTLYRFTGDEFIILLHSTANAGKFASLIKDTLSESFRVGPHLLDITASIGIYEVSSNDMDFSLARKKAELAMLEAKAKGGDCHHFLI